MVAIGSCEASAALQARSRAASDPGAATLPLITARLTIRPRVDPSRAHCRACAPTHLPRLGTEWMLAPN